MADEFKPVTIEAADAAITPEQMTEIVEGAQRYAAQVIERTTPEPTHDTSTNQ